ncbi:Putative uncharacterized protein, partial [Pararhodospirillum photometricum DSM 122]
AVWGTVPGLSPTVSGTGAGRSSSWDPLWARDPGLADVFAPQSPRQLRAPRPNAEGAVWAENLGRGDRQRLPPSRNQPDGGLRGHQDENHAGGCHRLGRNHGAGRGQNPLAVGVRDRYGRSARHQAQSGAHRRDIGSGLAPAGGLDLGSLRWAAGPGLRHS